MCIRLGDSSNSDSEMTQEIIESEHSDDDDFQNPFTHPSAFITFQNDVDNADDPINFTYGNDFFQYVQFPTLTF